MRSLGQHIAGAIYLVEVPHIIELGKDIAIVGNQQQRSFIFPAGVAEKFEHFGSVSSVQIAGGFIRDNEDGTIGKGASHGDALLLACRKLPRSVSETLSQSNATEKRLRPGTISSSRERHRQQDVFQTSVTLQQIERLKHVANGRRAQAITGRFIEFGNDLPLDGYAAGVRLKNAGDEIQKRRLPGTAVPSQRDMRPLVDLKVLHVHHGAQDSLR